MSDFSNYAENAVGNHLLRNTSLTSPTLVYLALFTAVSDAEAGTGTEVSGGSYARQAVTFGAPTNGVFTNSSAVTFPAATGNWGTVSHCAIFDAVSTGNAISIIKALTGGSVAVNTPNVFEIASGQLSFTLA
jgi:hypothetical protein